MGALALKFNSIGNENVAVGAGALYQNGANYNTAVGASTLRNNTAVNNTAVGHQALYTNTGGVDNTAVGKNSLYLNTVGNDNVAVGMSALANNNIQTNNTAIGVEALLYNGIIINAGSFVSGLVYTIAVVGTTNFMLIGAGANTVGTVFTATGIGAGSGQAYPNAINNVAVGYQAGYSLTSGRDNVFIGNGTGFNETLTKGATFIGSTLDNGYFNADGNIKIGIGVWTTLVHDIANNIAIGNQASRANHASNNIAIGGGANSWNTTGTGVVAMGTGAQGSNQWGATYSANYVTALGHFAMSYNKADYGTAVGSGSLYNNTTGINNTAIGYRAGYTNTVGDSSVFLGYNAGYYETISSKLFIDNATRASEADARVKALVYGVFDPTVAKQRLNINASVGIGGGVANSTSVLNIANLPISSVGLVSGDVWNNLGVLTII